MRFKKEKGIEDTDIWTNREDVAIETMFMKIGMIYKRIKQNTYRVYCSNCNAYHNYTYDKFKEIRYSKVCPECRYEHYELKKDNDKPRKVYMFYTFNCKKDGYECDVEFRFNKQPTVSFKHILRTIDGKTQVKDVVYTGFTYYYDLRPVWMFEDVYDWARIWRTVKSNRYSLSLYDWEGITHKSKRESLEVYNSLKLKSNQVRLILDHPFNDEQINAIKMFDVKEADSIYRNWKWIKRNERWFDRDKEKVNHNIYNPYLLDYLSKNDIDINLYRDYVRMCKLIDRKPDKPKDFKYWHDQVAEMVRVKNDRDLCRKVKIRGKKLESQTYHKKNITIKPFDSVSEINRVAKCLHNCLRTYAERYAEGSTNIYYMMVDDKPTLAIELKDNQIEQCYADDNEEPPRNLERIVERWASQL